MTLVFATDVALSSAAYLLGRMAGSKPLDKAVWLLWLTGCAWSLWLLGSVLWT